MVCVMCDFLLCVRGHQNRRYSVTACFDGNKRVVSGSEDGHIYVWDINSSKNVVQKLPGHNGEQWTERDIGTGIGAGGQCETAKLALCGICVDSVSPLIAVFVV